MRGALELSGGAGFDGFSNEPPVVSEKGGWGLSLEILSVGAMRGVMLVSLFDGESCSCRDIGGLLMHVSDIYVEVQWKITNLGNVNIFRVCM